MADKKISALTSASTPLAGTEVLPIVQSGSTVKVAVSSLTAGREVTASKFTTAGTAATPAQFLLASGTTTAFNYGRIANTGGDLWVGLEGSTGGDLFGGTSPYDSVLGTVNATNLHLAGGAAGIKLEHSTANIIVKTGNLVIGTAGKGIDFSASGGGFIGSKRGQIASSGGSTTTLVTLDNANENRIYLLTVRQSGGTSNTVIGQVISFGGSSSALRIAQDNTLVALDMNFTTSGLNVQLVIAAGFGSTTWDWVLTRIA
jgi:hypothetical protein